MSTINFKYHPVLDGEKEPQRKFCDRSSSRDSQDSITSEIENCSETTNRLCSYHSILKWLWFGQAALFLLSCTMLSSTFWVRSSTLKYVREFSAYSPAAAAVEYQSIKFNVTTGANPFVGAGPEVDQAWREISYDVGDQMISEVELQKLDMPRSSLKVQHPVSGAEGYRVGIEVFHQLHCINLLRKVTYKEYYEPLGGEFGKGPEALRMHTDHCLEILRLNTQCNADIGLFTFYMLPGDPLAWPELNSWHTCRNFDKVREWALDNSVGNMEIL